MPKVTTSIKSTGLADKHVYAYTRTMLVTLIFAPVKPDWVAIGKSVGKTKSQVFDMWRKSLYPNLIANKPWTSGDKELKIKIVMAVIQNFKPDWSQLALNLEGKSKSQLFDVWRKSIVPRLKKGETID